MIQRDFHSSIRLAASRPARPSTLFTLDTPSVTSPRLLTALVLVAITASSARAQQPARADTTHRPRPEDTEWYRPVPPVVTPAPYASTAPPSDAIVLFGGHDLSEWVTASDSSPARWTVANGILTVNKPTGDIRTKRTFGSYQLHVEWRIPTDVTGEGQERGNSGVYLAWTPRTGYELQIMDSYHNATYVNGMAGSMFKQYAPLANAARSPGEWQTYDVVWTAPTFGPDGGVRTPACVTAFWNGVLVQDHVALRGGTTYIGQPRYVAHGRAPILLQAHGDPSPPISFRNIWVRPL